MRVYIVTYNFNKIGADYSEFHSTLKTNFPKWFHHIKTCYLIATDLHTPNQIFNILGKHVDENDYILIMQVTRNYQGWLPPKAHEWIKTNVS